MYLKFNILIFYIWSNIQLCLKFGISMRQGLLILSTRLQHCHFFFQTQPTHCNSIIFEQARSYFYLLHIICCILSLRRWSLVAWHKSLFYTNQTVSTWLCRFELYACLCFYFKMVVFLKLHFEKYVCTKSYRSTCLLSLTNIVQWA